MTALRFLGSVFGWFAAVYGVLIAAAFGVILMFGPDKESPDDTTNELRAEPPKDSPNPATKQTAADKAIEEARKILEAAWTVEKDPAEKAKLLAAANRLMGKTEAAPKADSKWTEKVTVRPFMGGKFIDPHKDQPAYPLTLAGEPGFEIKSLHMYPAGSEVIQADGTVWEVVKPHLVEGAVRVIVRKKSK